MTARLGRRIACGVLFVAVVPVLAWAQEYPSRPITIVVPFPPGGTTDIIARVLAQKLTLKLKQPVVVENRSGGAGGSVGAAAVARAAPDGYTLMVTSPGPLVINHLLYKDIGYNPATAFAPISLTASVPIVLAAGPSFKGKTLKDLVEMGRANNPAVTFASAGNGGTAHLTMESFRQVAKFPATHVPFPGSGPAITAVMGGHVDVLFDNSPALLPQIQSGKLTALAVAGAKRTSAAPQIPTVAEQGYPGFESSSWFGLVAPAKTPQAVIDLLGREVREVLRAPEQLKYFEELGVEVVASTPTDFSAFIDSEGKRWTAVYKQSGAKLD